MHAFLSVCMFFCLDRFCLSVASHDVMLSHGELEQIVHLVVELQHGVPGGAGGDLGDGEIEV